MLKIYIAGKITGTRDYMDRFAAAEAALKAQGYKVLNPTAMAHFGIGYEEYMTICYAMIGVSDVVYMLAGWEDSPGACREHAYAEDELGLEVWYEMRKQTNVLHRLDAQWRAQKIADAIYDELHAAIKRKGLTVKGLSAEINVPYTTLLSVLKRRPPRFDPKLLAAASFLDVSVPRLFADNVEPRRNTRTGGQARET